MRYLWEGQQVPFANWIILHTRNLNLLTLTACLKSLAPLFSEAINSTVSGISILSWLSSPWTQIFGHLRSRHAKKKNLHGEGTPPPSHTELIVEGNLSWLEYWLFGCLRILGVANDSIVRLQNYNISIDVSRLFNLSLLGLGQSTWPSSRLVG